MARLGRLAWEDGDHAAALALLERAVATEVPASVWFDLGLVRQDLRDYDGAAAAYRKALQAISPSADLPPEMRPVLDHAKRTVDADAAALDAAAARAAVARQAAGAAAAVSCRAAHAAGRVSAAAPGRARAPAARRPARGSRPQRA